MFGTLNVLPEVPLTFVENPDLTSALSRRRRDKPHISCNLCRLRKVRCSGDPLGCDKCAAISAECQYPARDTRRKKRVTSSDPSNLDQVTSYERQRASGEDGGSGNGSGVGGGDGGGRTEGGRFSNPERVSSIPVLVNHDMDCGAVGSEQPCASEHQPWSYAESTGDTSSPGATKAGTLTFDEWQDLSRFLQPMLGGPPNPLGEGGGKDIVTDRMVNNSVLDRDGRFNVCGDFEGIDQTSSTDLSSPGGGLPPSWAMSVDSSTRSNSSRGRNTSHVRHESYRGFDSGPSGWSDKEHGSLDTAGTGRTTPHISSPPPAPRSLHSKGSSATTSTSNGSSTGDICKCLYLAAQLLEDLGAKSAQSDPTAIDVLLCVFRNALRQVTAILACQRCLRRTENTMLLAMAGRYMSLLCDELVGGYEQLQTAKGRQNGGEQDQFGLGSGSSSESGIFPRSPSSSALSSNSSGAWQEAGRGSAGFEANSRAAFSGQTSSVEVADEMWFSTYRIESSRERLQVFVTLVTVQMAEFSQLLEKLKARAGRQRGQMELLIEAEKRAQEARNRLHANLLKGV
ncbi:hypothetical protein C7999DRAFT_17374 [Corynascus novoguineensis]|uniref:Zn(2)-C6 fungal-type domain-containing protein n=1 Tax=Corynascus novoguineensis TaxID=1126955 RepID=A0AAN7HC48_9PEZI|nr:hypothetical protein C7999DRAFT_17374 [Corynascus novoguineensis]